MGFRGSGGGIGGTGLLPGPASESIDLGDAAGQGVSTRISLADHRHPVPAPNAAPLDLAAASGIGASTRPAAQDHVHRHRGVDHQLGGVADLSTYYGRSPFAARQTTGAVPAAGTVDVVVAFAQAFPDLNYTVEPAVEEATGGDTLRVRKIVSRTVNNVTIRVANQDALNPRTGTLHVLAYHDSVAVAAGTEAVDPIKVQAAPYNVIADGVYRAGAAAQLQAALDLADTTGRVIDWGAGTIVTDRLTYRCQSMIGQGRTIIQGRPSQDVFWADPTLTGDVRDGPVLRDFVVVVDDSVNAAAAFPNRGGVGNAGFAFEWNDATTPRPLRWHRGTVENVQVRSLSLGAINNSCGLYTQHPVNRMSIRNLFFHRLVYGWRDHWPAIGLAGIEHFSDHNHIDSIYFNGCTHPARWVNWMNDKISN